MKSKLRVDVVDNDLDDRSSQDRTLIRLVQVGPPEVVLMTELVLPRHASDGGARGSCQHAHFRADFIRERLGLLNRYKISFANGLEMELPALDASDALYKIARDHIQLLKGANGLTIELVP